MTILIPLNLQSTSTRNNSQCGSMWKEQQQKFQNIIYIYIYIIIKRKYRYHQNCNLLGLQPSHN